MSDLAVSFDPSYDDYAVYLPSLQNSYAQLPLLDPENVRNGTLPAGLELQDLNFLNPANKLWHTKYTLYSAGQFNSSQLRTPDIVSTRDRNNTKIIGDSGGFQIATGKLKATAEWRKDALKPNVIFDRWMKQTDIRDQMLRWMDVYCDYAMTLDLPLATRKNKESPFRKLSAQQIIDLTVENLRYFEANTGKATGARAKYLNVLQDDEEGNGDAWYRAVTQFKFTKGWALGGKTKDSLDSLLYWLRRLLRDGLLEDCEWIHVLQASPPVSSVYLTAIQRALRKATGNEGLRVSYDSSSPFQLAGKHKLVAQVPMLTDDIKTWRIPTIEFPQNPKHLTSQQATYLTQAASPVMQQVSMEEFMVAKGAMSRNWFDSFAEQLLINHNMYIYHSAAVDACDLVFDEVLKDETRIPKQVREGLASVEEVLG
jgi:hypothetical protein